VGRLVVWSLSVALCCVSVSAASAARKPPFQHVTIFGDSVAAALNWDSTAKRIVERSNRVRFELRPCGRLVQPGCISPPPPSVLHDVRGLGQKIGPNVIVFVGYNDDPATYRHGIPDVLRAMRNRGVKHVLWLTLHAISKQYVDINHAIYAAKRKWRSLMTVLDWNHYSVTHAAWYESDRIHLSGTGAVGFATYLHRSLKRLGLTGLPPALRG
jgi:hypothetical protein